MGRPPSNGGPSFRFTQAEIAEMEAILQAHKAAMPAREVLVALAEKFSNSEERSGKIEVQMKQVWNWFQNRRYAIRAKAAKSPGKLNITHMARDDSGMVKGVPQPTQPQPHQPQPQQHPHAAPPATVRSLPQPPQHTTVPSAAVRTFPQAPQHPPAFSVQIAGRVADNSQMEYEAKSARDGAWYDVSTFLSHRSLETGDPEVLVRFAGFGAEEDEWVNVRKNVRQRSLPCESSECVAVLPNDLILCFQEGKEQALYFDAHVLDAQRRRHDVRGCRCRFLVRYDHDQSEEIVALRKICRRPETDYRLQQLHAVNESLSSTNHNKNVANNNINNTNTNNNNIHTVSTLRVYPPPALVQPKQPKVEPMVPPEAPQKRQRLDPMVQTERSERQFTVEPVVLAAPLSDVPQNQQTVQSPAVAATSAQLLVEPHKVEPVVLSPYDQASQEPKVVEPMVAQKVEPVVPSPSDQASSQEPKEVEPMVAVPTDQTPTRADEVPVELQKLQPVMHDSSTEVSVEPHKVETVEEVQIADTNKTEPVPSGEISHEPLAVGPAIPPSTAEVPPLEAPEEPHEGETEVAESQKEPVVCGSSVEVPPELHEVQPNDASALEAIETKVEEPVVLYGTSVEVPAELHEVLPNDASAFEAIETKVDEPVVCGGSSVEVPAELHEVQPNDASALEAIETKVEEPMVPVSTNDPNVADQVAIETKTEAVSVPTNDPNVIDQQPKDSEIMDAKVAENADVAPENDSGLASDNATGDVMEE